MTTWNERSVRVDGGELWCAARASASTDPETAHAVLLWNGGPGCPDYLRPVAELLPAEMLAIRFDPRGCGRSTARKDSAAGAAGVRQDRFTVEQAIDDVEAIRRSFGIRRWSVCGHSFGADLALLYALRHPDRVRSLVCLAGGRASEPREWYRVYRARRDRGEEVVPEFDFPVNLRAKTQLTDDWRRTTRRPGFLAELGDLDLPVHFIYPEGDIRPSWPVEQVASLLPRGEFRLLSGCDHFMWRENSTGLAAELDRVFAAGMHSERRRDDTGHTP